MESKTECSENIDADNDENTFYADNDFELDEDYTPETADDDSKSHDLSGNYQLNVALNNLKQIQDTVQSNYLSEYIASCFKKYVINTQFSSRIAAVLCE